MSDDKLEYPEAGDFWPKHDKTPYRAVTVRAPNCRRTPILASNQCPMPRQRNPVSRWWLLLLLPAIEVWAVAVVALVGL